MADLGIITRTYWVSYDIESRREDSWVVRQGQGKSRKEVIFNESSDPNKKPTCCLPFHLNHIPKSNQVRQQAINPFNK